MDMLKRPLCLSKYQSLKYQSLGQLSTFNLSKLNSIFFLFSNDKSDGLALYSNNKVETHN